MSNNLQEAILVGAGQRGREAFGAFAERNPSLLRYTAVADPDEGRRDQFASDHGIPSERRFSSWEDLRARPPVAPIAVNATMDREHLASTLALLEAGYHVMLEKPMAVTPEQCLLIGQAAAESGRMVQITHPLRFTPFYTMVKELLDSGAVGRVLAISMEENVGYWHFAHSFVRGNWGRGDRSGPLMLTKCCHDMDIASWLAGQPVDTVASHGGLRFFREENAPEGATERCLDGCPAADECPFYAPSLYLGEHTEWPVSVISLDSSYEARRRALETGPYGRCVYRCDNDTIDQQTVTAEFADGTLFDFAVRGGSLTPCRTIRILGTRGELSGRFEENQVTVSEFAPGMGERLPATVYTATSAAGAHGGGDEGAIRHFLDCVARGDTDRIRRSLGIAIEGHLLSFAAEEARSSGQTVRMEDFRGSVAYPAT